MTGEEHSKYRAEISRKKTWKRAEKYYPDDNLKKELNDYALRTGEYKSELATRLVKSFFAARREKGEYPTVITILSK